MWDNLDLSKLARFRVEAAESVQTFKSVLASTIKNKFFKNNLSIFSALLQSRAVAFLAVT